MHWYGLDWASGWRGGCAPAFAAVWTGASESVFAGTRMPPSGGCAMTPQTVQMTIKADKSRPGDRHCAANLGFYRLLDGPKAEKSL
jgi:hypothetical protein